jgi:hypothetical protein
LQDALHSIDVVAEVSSNREKPGVIRVGNLGSAPHDRHEVALLSSDDNFVDLRKDIERLFSRLDLTKLRRRRSKRRRYDSRFDGKHKTLASRIHPVFSLGQAWRAIRSRVRYLRMGTTVSTEARVGE